MTERYMDKDEARAFMAGELGIELNERQMRRAFENRKLPFFRDPVTGRLRITEAAIRNIYALPAAGESSAPHAPHSV